MDLDFSGQVLLSPFTAPASVYNETARLLAPAPAICTSARTSGLSVTQLASAQLQPALNTRSFLVPDPTGTNPIAHLANITGTAISAATDIDTFIKGCHFQTIAAPPSSSHHPSKSLFQALATSGFPSALGKPWSLDAIRTAIKKGPHTSTCNSSSTIYCCKELSDRLSRGFSLLLTADTAILLFGRSLRIYRLASVPQDNQKDRLICNSTSPTPSGDYLLPPSSKDTLAVNVSTDRSVAPQAMQFFPCLPRILQQIWEADYQYGPVYLSK